MVRVERFSRYKQLKNKMRSIDLSEAVRNKYGKQKTTEDLKIVTDANRDWIVYLIMAETLITIVNIGMFFMGP